MEPCSSPLTVQTPYKRRRTCRPETAAGPCAHTWMMGPNVARCLAFCDSAERPDQIARGAEWRASALRRPRRRTNPARRNRDGIDVTGELPDYRWRVGAARVPEHAMRARAYRDIEHGRWQVGRVKAARRLARDIRGVERKKTGIRELLEEM